jgi:hypothetical protein
LPRHGDQHRGVGKRAKARLGGGASGVALVIDGDDQGEAMVALGRGTIRRRSVRRSNDIEEAKVMK